MTELEQKIGYCFKDSRLLQTALTHSSYANEKHKAGCECYERLEFLGDSILGFCTAEFLYRSAPVISEGQMTRERAEIVCEKSLYRVASSLDLGKCMRLGRGEEATGGRNRVSVLADMVEALIAAIYLDSGLTEAKSFINRFILIPEIIEASKISDDYKTALQEKIQEQSGSRIEYVQTGETGPDHNKTFTFEVFVNGEAMGRGSGRTKKEAEQNAARDALEKL